MEQGNSVKEAIEFVTTARALESLRARMLKMTAAAVMVAIAMVSMPSHAITQGVFAATLKPKSSGGGCASCHNPQGGTIASVTIVGPATLDAGTTGIYTVTATQEMTIIAAYSPRKKKANLTPEYSVLKPETSSDSASGRSNGFRFVSATPETK